MDTLGALAQNGHIQITVRNETNNARAFIVNYLRVIYSAHTKCLNIN